jgi:hypothetical protein
MHYLAALVSVAVVLAGCAGMRTAPTGAGDDGAVYAAPGPDLVGTWKGTAFAVGGTLYHISAPVELTIEPDGDWSWRMGGKVQGRGRVASRGADVILVEDWALKGNTQGTNAAEETIDLQRRGDQLWGVTRAFIPGAQNAIQLKKAEP